MRNDALAKQNDPDGAADVSRPRLGLCSVTFRTDTVDRVVERARDTGLESIEWGSDVHVPAGDLREAERTRRVTEDAGLTVCSYGSYVGFPWSTGSPENLGAVLDSAQALGAPRVRLWAGPEASSVAVDRGRTTELLAHYASEARSAGVEVAIEFHSGTLADTAESTLRLLDDLEHRVTTYWQPRIGATDDEALSDLQALGSSVSTAHAFSWDAMYGRHPLASREAFWRLALKALTTLPRVTDVLIEFLPGDDADVLRGEAEQLRTWLGQAKREAN